jgi:hypothetical protein
MTTPIPPEKRAAMVPDMRLTFLNLGRNEIARRHGVSPGIVSKIAREEHHYFERATQTAEATAARRADCEVRRSERENQLLDDYLALPATTRLRDGRETRAARLLSYQLYDLHRHHR